MEDAALIAAAGAAARAAITAMDSQCMAKESHLAAMGAQISQVSLAMSDVAKEIKWRMSENNVSHAANWRFVVGNASKIAGKLDEVFQRGKVLKDRAPSKTRLQREMEVGPRGTTGGERRKTKQNSIYPTHPATTSRP